MVVESLSLEAGGLLPALGQDKPPHKMQGQKAMSKTVLVLSVALPWLPISLMGLKTKEEAVCKQDHLSSACIPRSVPPQRPQFLQK